MSSPSTAVPPPAIKTFLAAPHRRRPHPDPGVVRGQRPDRVDGGHHDRPRHPATSSGTAITAGTFAMAAFILLGAKVGARFGPRRVFQIAVVIHGVAMAAVALSVSPAMLFVAQAASGAVIALIAPALTVFIATNYHGTAAGQAIGLPRRGDPAAGVLALLIAGTFASTIGWRWSFA